MSKKIYIFGAHSRAQTLGVYLKKINADLTIEAYLVDNEEINKDFIDDVPVLKIDQNTILDKDKEVYLGTRGIYHKDLTDKLIRMGIKKIIPVTPELDRQLRNDFLEVYFKEMGRRFVKLEDIKDSVCIYVAKSIMDKSLKENYRLSDFEKEIQVGAALTDSSICDIKDNMGENISDRNRQFCELTAMYWMWKNAQQEIVGLEHYRRHFILEDDWIQKMYVGKVDVILPTPLYVKPSLERNYKERHVSEDWDCMMECLRQFYPACFDDAKAFFNTNCYSPCNMFITRKEVLNELCTWMFPILFKCAELIGDRNDNYQNRYVGFMSERLISFFFERNKEKYTMVYADKNFLE